MNILTTLLFAGTYLGMAAGQVPGLKIERTGIALVALALLLLFSGGVSASDGKAILAAIDGPTLILLFSMMILSAQFGAAGLYDLIAFRIIETKVSPRRLLAVVVAIVGLLSALLANDIVVFALTPLLCAGFKGRGLDPRPYLLGMVAAANAGSAATLIGNPQNILIGQLGGLNFWEFFKVCAIPSALSLVVVYGVIAYIWRRELGMAPATDIEPAVIPAGVDRFQLLKGLAASLLILALFMTPLPRAFSAFGVVALLLISRSLGSRQLLKPVDWPLLLLIACLLAITGAFAQTGYPEIAVQWLASHGLLPDRLMLLAPLTLFLSSTVGNVPAVTLLMTVWKNLDPGVMYALALLSTLSGNLLLTGSLANLIVVVRARASGVVLSFGDFARAGILVTLLSLMIACIWLAASGWTRLV